MKKITISDFILDSRLCEVDSFYFKGIGKPLFIRTTKNAIYKIDPTKGDIYNIVSKGVKEESPKEYQRFFIDSFSADFIELGTIKTLRLYFDGKLLFTFNESFTDKKIITNILQ